MATRKSWTGSLTSLSPPTENEFAALAYEESAEALIFATILNDLAKVPFAVKRVRTETGIEEVDHNKVIEMGSI